MTPKLLDYLCDPISRLPLSLNKAVYDHFGRIVSGELVGASGTVYPIINGIPRFVPNVEISKTVNSFGNEWNYFNFTDFKPNWLTHTVANTFGSTAVFKDKVVVDAGGGSGAQTLWMLESGAKYVIMLELSHSVDDVVQRNIKPSGFANYDVIQCSIDMPPIKEQSIHGMVICHNVIQHTPSVEKTAHALFAIVAPGGEFVFNCYPLHDRGIKGWVVFLLVYRPLRMVLSRLPFWAILSYARLMGIIRLLPVIGGLVEKVGICVRGDVPVIQGETVLERLKRSYKSTVLNTFDYFGSHKYQHHKRDKEIQLLVASLQKDHEKVLNSNEYFSNHRPAGCALRIFR